MQSLPLIATGVSIIALLFLVLKVRLPAFIALIFVSLGFGLSVGMTPNDVIDAVKNGMGGTLGFVAVVVGLGAMMGALLEQSGGVQAISSTLLKKFGTEKSQYALGLIGFLVAIPVFLDIAFIILVPVLYGLQKRTQKPLIYFAIPLLAGLAVTHSFIPPTPGPIAVADILKADLGWVILFGTIAGLPAAFIGGPLLANRLVKMAEFQNTQLPSILGVDPEVSEPENPINFGAAMFVIVLPLILILTSTITKINIDDTKTASPIIQGIIFIGHPFISLLIGCLVAWYALGIRRGVPSSSLMEVMTKALEPAGIVVLVTGAGGVFKQILVSSGAGADLAGLLQANSLPIIGFAFIVAAIVRVAQGSATVAMITAAGLTAPVAETINLQGPPLALLVIVIAAGATVISHVNDSGFWLVNRYLGLTEEQTLKSWTVSTTLIGVSAFIITSILWIII